MVSQSANGLGSGSGIVHSTSRLPVAGAYVRLGAHSGLKSDIARGPKSANRRHGTPQQKKSRHLAGIDISRLVRKPNRWSSRNSRILHGILQFSALSAKACAASIVANS